MKPNPIVVQPGHSKQTAAAVFKNEILKYTVGARVNHIGFGEGTITKVIHFNGSHLIEVKFEKGGIRKLLLEIVLRNKMIGLVLDDAIKRKDLPEFKEALKREQYETGYEDVKELFTQQTRIIRDRYRNRWVKCEKCGTIKQDVEFASYGGQDHVNLGVCRECSRNL